MAYTPTVTINHVGGRDYIVQINETESGTATEATIAGLPIKGRLIAMFSDLTAGSGTTIDPVLTTASNSTLSVQTIADNDTAAATISNLALPEFPYYSADGTLYWKSKCDSGADNVTVTILLFKAGW